MARWEWLIMLVGFVGLLGWELWRTRRAMRGDGKRDGG